ncbi:MAG: basic amino acid/polyamine antiporter, family [Thermoplasmata archaeon]|nr:basic amino acid/polyamine antiporter, family [Thermoplasmata archaeon]
MGGPIQFKANLRLFEAITIIVGSMIGSGILLLPADMAELMPSPGLILVVFVTGAVLTIVGALTFAEMAAMFPRAGGQYHFLKEGMGRAYGYMFGWTQFWVIQTGIVAGVAVAVTRFTKFFVERNGGHLGGHPVPLTDLVDVGPCVQESLQGVCTKRLIHLDPFTLPAYGDALVAITAILLLMGLNMLSTRFGGIVQNISTVAKVLGLASLVAIIFIGGSLVDHAYEAQGGGFAPEGMGAGALVVAFGGALALSLFAYDGWPQATYVAGEVRNAKRNLPLALIIGPLITAVVYIALTAAYFYVIPIDEAVQLGINDERIAPVAAGKVWEYGPVFISGVALVSVFGTVNGFLLTAPRIFYALSHDGALLPSMGKISSRNTPAWAIYFTALWASLLVLSGGYQQIVTMVVFGIFLFYIPTAISHMRMRKTHKHIERPFKTPLFPLVPIVFLLASIFIVGIILVGSLLQGLIALVLILLGVPFYFMQRPRMLRVEAERAGEAAAKVYGAQADADVT